MPDPENEIFMQVKTALQNNWDIRISLYENSMQFKVNTFVNSIRCSSLIETEYASAGVYHGQE